MTINRKKHSTQTKVIVIHVTEKPIFEGKATIAIAREIYGVHFSSDNQLDVPASRGHRSG